ncbi:MAG: hypothetical protein IV100_32315 [Myxococcales bacterium]|nr:hypothetical protein [Myxococcales bacterium]
MTTSLLASNGATTGSVIAQEAPSTIDVPLVAGASAGAAAAVGLPLIVICAVCFVRRGREKKESKSNQQQEHQPKESDRDIAMSAISAPAPPIVDSSNYGPISAAPSDHYSPMVAPADDYAKGDLNTVA